MKIGIYGGAFNPVHNGHLNLIDVLSRVPMHPDFKNLDKFIIVPTADPPHRSGADFASGIDMVNMLKIAIKNNDVFDKSVSYKRFEISDIEFSMVGKSYTYNTIKALKGLYPEDEFYLFMGSDQLFNFREWYKYNKILKMAHIVGFGRCKEDNEKIKQFLIDNKDLGADAVYYSPIEVSSSQIRARIKNGESLEGLVPDGVAEYIREHGLYV